MMPSYEFENGQLREENNALRHARNAAQQRAEQAERERDEAIDLLMRIRAITTASLAPAPTVKADTPETAGIMPSIAAPLEWTPKTGAEIAADMEGKPAILPTDFDVNATPTVKADDARQHKFIEIPGHVHWLFLYWPMVEPDGEFLEACLRNYNLWIDDGYTEVKHFPMGDGKLLIEFRKPEVSA